jgi:hypothetical protein
MVTKVLSDWIFKVKHLVNNVEQEVHGQRLKFYFDKDLHVSFQLREQIQHDEKLFEVEKILMFKVTPDGAFYHIKWRGFSEEEATWEPASVIEADLPEVCLRFKNGNQIQA